MNIPSISVHELANVKKSNQVFILDVRTYEEYLYANIGGVHIPLDELVERYSELPKDKTIYCLCHHGVRSLYACQFLFTQGYTNISNIEGGIENWSLQIDPNIPRY